MPKDKRLAQKRITTKLWRERDPNRTWSRNLKRAHKITIEQYLELLQSQNGKCAICKGDNSGLRIKKRLAVDHNHQTGKRRGLLCDNCNRGLGFLKDNPVILLSAVDYLKNHG